MNPSKTVRGPSAKGDSSGVPQDQDAGAIPADNVFHVLQNKRRRDVLRYLEDESDIVDMRELAEQVAAWEHDTTVQALSSDQRQRVYIALYQSHLPKLDEEGIIAYNQSRGTVERLPPAEQFTPYVNSVDGDEMEDRQRDRWSGAVRYAGAAALSALLVGGLGAGLQPVSLLAVTVLAVVALTAAFVLTELLI